MYHHAKSVHKCPSDVKEKLLTYINKTKIQRNETYGILPKDDIQYIRDDEEEKDHSEHVRC